jgi:ATP adenylyltransferase
MAFINSKKPDKCVFCKAGEENNDPENLVVYRGKTVFVMLNKYPYTTGHIMIIPFRHVGDFLQLTDDELCETAILTRKFTGVLQKAFKPEGFNIGANLGTCAGAGIADHVHLHIVPRWNGDTNFMPVLADLKVHPTDLQTVYKLIKESI